MPSAEIIVQISSFFKTSLSDFFSVLSGLPRSGNIAWCFLSLPSLALPPAESPSTMNISFDLESLEDKTIHIHVPEGAIPKDGPSAGITMATAIISALTGKKVSKKVAMTGEISLRGRVMAIGGLKEKTMAALRYGIHTVIIPKDNERDLEEIDQTVRNALHFVIAESVDTVLATALLRKAEAAPTILKDIPTDVAKKPRKATIQQ